MNKLIKNAVLVLVTLIAVASITTMSFGFHYNDKTYRTTNSCSNVASIIFIRWDKINDRLCSGYNKHENENQELGSNIPIWVKLFRYNIALSI